MSDLIITIKFRTVEADIGSEFTLFYIGILPLLLFVYTYNRASPFRLSGIIGHGQILLCMRYENCRENRNKGVTSLLNGPEKKTSRRKKSRGDKDSRQIKNSAINGIRSAKFSSLSL